MPIYRYRCDCGNEEEHILPMSERNNSRYCECGNRMGRVLETPALVLTPITGRNKVLNTLNREAGYKAPLRSERSVRALAQGLNPPRTAVGRGFG